MNFRFCDTKYINQKKRMQVKVFNSQKLKIHFFSEFQDERWVFQDEISFSSDERFKQIVNNSFFHHLHGFNDIPVVADDAENIDSALKAGHIHVAFRIYQSFSMNHYAANIRNFEPRSRK